MRLKQLLLCLDTTDPSRDCWTQTGYCVAGQEVRCLRICPLSKNPDFWHYKPPGFLSNDHHLVSNNCSCNPQLSLQSTYWKTQVHLFICHWHKHRLPICTVQWCCNSVHWDSERMTKWHTAAKIRAKRLTGWPLPPTAPFVNWRKFCAKLIIKIGL